MNTKNTTQPHHRHARRRWIPVLGALSLLASVLVSFTAPSSASTGGEVVITADKVGSGNDGWYRHEDGSITWISADCRASLQAAGHEPVVVDYHADIAGQPSGGTVDCGIAPTTTGGTEDSRPGVTIVITGDKQGAGNDGWYRLADGSIGYINSGCRATLEQAGAVPEVVEWSVIQAGPDAGALDCDDLTTSEPTEPTPATNPADTSGGTIVITGDKQGAGNDGWYRLADGSIGYINSGCRATLEQAGAVPEVVEWSVIQAGPDAGPLNCDNLLSEPSIAYGESVTRWIEAADGGQVSLAKARLDVPAGAMARDGHVSITEMTVGGQPTYDFHIHTPWDGLVLVTVPADLGGPVAPNVDPQSMTLQHYDDERGVWFDEPVSVVDFEAGTLSSWVDDLSWIKNIRKAFNWVTGSNPTELQKARIKSSGDISAQAALIYAEDAWMRMYCPHPDDNNAGTVVKWLVRHASSPTDLLPSGYHDGYDPIIDEYFRTGCETYKHPSETIDEFLAHEPTDPSGPPIPLGVLTREHCQLQRAFPAHYCDQMPTEAQVAASQAQPNGGSSGPTGGDNSTGTPPANTGGNGSVSLGWGAHKVGSSYYVTGSGSGWTPGETYWIACSDYSGTFVNTAENRPVVYARRTVDSQGRIGWGSHICFNYTTTTVTVWTSSGKSAVATIAR